jgi:hypothetical protein
MVTMIKLLLSQVYLGFIILVLLCIVSSILYWLARYVLVVSYWQCFIAVILVVIIQILAHILDGIDMLKRNRR